MMSGTHRCGITSVPVAMRSKLYNHLAGIGGFIAFTESSPNLACPCLLEAGTFSFSPVVFHYVCGNSALMLRQSPIVIAFVFGYTLQNRLYRSVITDDRQFFARLWTPLGASRSH